MANQKNYQKVLERLVHNSNKKKNHLLHELSIINSPLTHYTLIIRDRAQISKNN